MRRPTLAVAAEAAWWLSATLLPWLLQAIGEGYYIGFATRLLIYALAATSLNFVVGYGGMVAFGHAAFFGSGAYLVAGGMAAGLSSAWLAWPLTMLATALLATPIALVSLRTQGVYFIMITLAFAQMLYYTVISLPLAGGEDGLSLAHRSTLPPFSLDNDITLYWTALAVLAIALLLLKRLQLSRYGRALAGVRSNALRMEALGYPLQTLRWVCFVVGAAFAALAGALLVNLNGMASPTQLYWTQSGILLVMVIMGGVGRRYGGVIGAIAFLGLEEIFRQASEHSHLPIGLILLAIVLFAPRGLAAAWPTQR